MQSRVPYQNEAALENTDEPTKLMIRACDLCRKKKIRCEIIVGSDCVQCVKYNEHCAFTPAAIKKGPRRPPGYKHVEELETRMKRMEALLRSQRSTPPTGSDEERGKKTGSESLKRKRKASNQLLHPAEAHRGQKGMERQSPKTTTSSTSLLNAENSPKSVQNVRAPVVNDSQFPVPDWKLTTASDIFSRRDVKPLPPKYEAQLLIQEAFEGYNAVFPIFDQLSFLRAFEVRYPVDERDDVAWWACLNVVFALAHRFRAIRTQDSDSEDFHAWGYLQNALAVVAELTLLEPGLLAVQALLGMAVVLEATPHPEPCSVLISTAMKLAQRMKLHRRNQGSDLSSAEGEQRTRVFWVAYVIDKEISLRTGDPPAQNDDDMDVDLPAETTNLSVVGINDVNLFNLHIGLAIVLGQIYKNLSSAKARKISQDERSLVSKQLLAMLNAWHRSVPDEFASNDTRPASAPKSLHTLLHSVILNFTHLNAVNTIHSLSRIDSPWNTGSTGPSAQPQLPSVNTLNDALCLSEARKSMQLLPMMPQGNYAYVWLLLNDIFLACAIILSNITSSSTRATATAKDDLKLIEPVWKLLKSLRQNGANPDVERMDQSLRGLWKEASLAIAGGKETTKSYTGAGHPAASPNSNPAKEIKTVEDFIGRIQQGANCWNLENWVE